MLIGNYSFYLSRFICHIYYFILLIVNMPTITCFPLDYMSRVILTNFDIRPHIEGTSLGLHQVINIYLVVLNWQAYFEHNILYNRMSKFVLLVDNDFQELIFHQRCSRRQLLDRKLFHHIIIRNQINVLLAESAKCVRCYIRSCISRRHVKKYPGRFHYGRQTQWGVQGSTHAC